MVTESNREISFVIEKYLGVLSEAQNGWRKELNLVSWNGKKAKLDLREWSPDHTHMAKGITLRYEEARALQRALYRWLTGHGKPVSENPLPAAVPESSEEDFAADASIADAGSSELPGGDDFPAAADPETGEILELAEDEDAGFFEEAPAEQADEADLGERPAEPVYAPPETSDF